MQPLQKRIFMGEATMTTANADQTPTPQHVGKIECDMFCAHCGYNLFSLDVTRDDRLGIPIVRCPECGKFHPAGVATGAGRLWLNRLAAFLLASWISFLLVSLLTFAFLAGCLDFIKIQAFVDWQRTNTPNVRGIDWCYVPFDPKPGEEYWTVWLGDRLVDTASVLLGSLAGIAFVSCLSHLKKRWAAALFAAPMVALGVVILIFYGERVLYPNWMLPWFAQRFAFVFVLQCAGIMAGARFGRPIVRAILRILLPRRLLQYLHFLWHADKLTPPPINPQNP
jgi:hypothetical protein